jgi:CHAD domain-containing protein
MIRRHAIEQASALLRRMAFQANRTARRTDAGRIHDLRVSIRRLTACLELFRQFFPRGQARRISRKVGVLMDLASEVRNRDIALELLKKAAIPAAPSWALEREQAAAELRDALKHWSRRDAHRKWRVRLDL